MSSYSNRMAVPGVMNGSPNGSQCTEDHVSDSGLSVEMTGEMNVYDKVSFSKSDTKDPVQHSEASSLHEQDSDDEDIHMKNYRPPLNSYVHDSYDDERTMELKQSYGGEVSMGNNAEALDLAAEDKQNVPTTSKGAKNVPSTSKGAMNVPSTSGFNEEKTRRQNSSVNYNTNKNKNLQQDQSEVKALLGNDSRDASRDIEMAIEPRINQINSDHKYFCSKCSSVVKCLICAVIVLGFLLVAAIILCFIFHMNLINTQQYSTSMNYGLPAASTTKPAYSVTFHIDWKVLKLMDDTNENVVLPFEVPTFQDDFTVHGDKIRVQHNATYLFILSLNLEDLHTSTDAGTFNQKHRSFICLLSSRPNEICKRISLFTNSSSSVNIVKVLELYQGDDVWVTMKGVRLLYISNAGNYLDIAKLS